MPEYQKKREEEYESKMKNLFGIAHSNALKMLGNDGQLFTSDYKAMHIIAAVVKALGHSLDNLNVSRTMLSNHRKKNRKTIANEIKDKFSARIEENFLVFHS